MNSTRAAPIYDSASQNYPAIEEAKEALRYRHLIQQIVRRNVIARYKRSFLGVAWTMLNPLGMMMVKVIVFSAIFGRDPTYPAYVLSGLLAFSFFSEATNTTIGNLVWGGNLLKRIYIPPSVFAIGSVGTSMVNLALSTIPLIIVVIVVGLPIKTTILFLPISVLLLSLFSLGFGMVLSTFSVYYPDIAEMYKVVLRAWLYLTPVIYPEDILPDIVLQWVRILNPMYHLVRIFRYPIYNGKIPTMVDFIPGLIISVVMFLIGWAIFSRKAHEFAYRA
ncbi:MAG: ABC transporter permease [Anaerolineales bacterium]|jgi:ABC-type polysaccharide/polyol phosphate export permease